MSRYQKGKPIWILLKQETVSGSGICWAICKSAPRSRQITTPAPHHSGFYRPDALAAAQPTVSKHINVQCIFSRPTALQLLAQIKKTLEKKSATRRRISRIIMASVAKMLQSVDAGRGQAPTNPMCDFLQMRRSPTHSQTHYATRGNQQTDTWRRLTTTPATAPTIRQRRFNVTSNFARFAADTEHRIPNEKHFRSKMTNPIRQVAPMSETV